ncbi:hypothetical protein KAR48_17725 [bacterium]|nr:hypothetical protein [bacterium]
MISVKIILCTLPIIIFCSKSPDWEGYIKCEKNVAYVHNTEKPIFQDNERFQVEEVLAICSDPDKRYFLSTPVDVAVDIEKNIYIVDVRENSLLKFDQAGQYLKSVQRQGSGPGELFGPGQVMSIGGQICVCEAGNLRFSVFSNELDFIDIFKAGVGINSFSCSISEHDSDRVYIAASGAVSLNENIEHNIFVFSRQNQFEKSFGERIFLGDRAFFGPQYALPVICCFGEDILCGFSTPYQIRLYMPTGKLYKVIYKDDKLVNTVKKCKIPPIGNRLIPQISIDHVYTLGKDYIVTRLENRGEGYQEKYKNAVQFQDTPKRTDSMFLYDFFDSEGRFLFTFTPPDDMGLILHFDDYGHFYTYYSGESEVYVKKYKYSI